MELIIELLEAAESQGILTGGSDPEGNYAFVVIDSKATITVIVRPTGRATLIANGEEEDYDLEADDDGEVSAQFMSDLAEALVNDNLDSKVSKLNDVIDSVIGTDEDDEDEDTDSEDDESDDAVDSDEERDDDTDDVDDDSSADEETKPKLKRAKRVRDEAVDEDEDEIASSILKDELEAEAETLEEDALTPEELAIMREYMPHMLDSMIETAGPDAAPFNIAKFNKAIGMPPKNKKAMSLFGGSLLRVKFPKGRIVAELVIGDLHNKANKSMRRSGGAAGKVIRLYQKHTRQYAKLNGINFAKVDGLLTKIITAAEAFDRDTTEALLKELILTVPSKASYASQPKTGVYTIGYGRVHYFMGYDYDGPSESWQVWLIADGRYLMRVKAEYMISIAAGFAKCSTLLGSSAHPDAILIGKRDQLMSNRLMKIAVKLGYNGEKAIVTKIKTSGSIKLPKVVRNAPKS